MNELFEGAITVRGIAIAAIVVGIIYIWVFLVVMLDLWAGIRKAKQRGEYRSSKKLRRTIEKLTGYYNIMLAVTFVDGLLMFGIALLRVNIPHIPYLTFVGAAIVGVIEIKSIFEKAEDKHKEDISDAVATLSRVLSREELKDLIVKAAGRSGHGYGGEAVEP